MIRFAGLKPSNSQTAAIIAAIFLSATALAQTVTSSLSKSDEQSLQRGAIEDITPQQKYRSAIREAGGALKESLRECAQLSNAEKVKCNRDARMTYDREMAEARRILN
ncbi:MAG: hypothetical protein ABL931_10675 [Usitatibacteraceae bacterium]